MPGSPEQKGLHIATFGCQMNQYDSDRIAGLMAGLGYAQVDQPQEADLIVINTCSVRERAEQKVYSYLGNLKRLKANNPELLIGVGGCVAQQEGVRLLKQVPHLDFVFGTGTLERLPELVDEARKGRRQALTDPRPLGQPQALAPLPNPGLKALVTVMRGCDNYCSYCVVPYVRGREHSRPAGEVLDEVRSLVEAGVREITLLGQNVNSYRDPDGGGDFAGLLHRVGEIDELWRIRFATSHPKDLGPALMEAMAGEAKVMEQLHLPAQAGSNRILKAMGRGYTREDYLALVAQLRRMVPGVALGGDFIVGFPGESEDEFKRSLSLLDQVRYDFIYSFKYSDRPFTRASGMSAKLDEETKSRRLVALQARQHQIGRELHQELLGKVEEVLVEGPAPKGQGLLTGRSRAGRVASFAGGPELVGQLVAVRVEEGKQSSLLGSQPRERREAS
jgi:tRNA-2-methylthio-N6-dimethylallyladenosine synthase